MAQACRRNVKSFILVASSLILSPFSALAKEPIIMGALGDSISTGFNSKQIGDNRDYSWSTATGAGVNSHLKRLGAQAQANVLNYSEAIAGSIVYDLQRQVTRLLSHAPDYVTITIGANDVCAWNDNYQLSLDRYETELRGVIQRLVDERPKIKIQLAPIPNLYNLWEVAVDRPTCQQRWDLFNICRPLLAKDRTDLDRQHFIERWRATNETLHHLAKEFLDNVLFSLEVADTRFEWNHVSPIDCFHPSIEGQDMIAKKTWQRF